MFCGSCLGFRVRGAGLSHVHGAGSGDRLGVWGPSPRTGVMGSPWGMPRPAHQAGQSTMHTQEGGCCTLSGLVPSTVVYTGQRERVPDNPHKVRSTASITLVCLHFRSPKRTGWMPPSQASKLVGAAQGEHTPSTAKSRTQINGHKAP